MTIKDMLGRSGVVSREEALRRILKHATYVITDIETVGLSSSLGRVVGEDIIAPVDVPEFARSTMDGYAVRSRDTFGATEAMPALLKIAGEIPMGALPEMPISKGECMRILTGGALPSGADAVVMLEYAQAVDQYTIEVMRPVAPLENIVEAGDDLRKGERVLGKGHRIRPQDMAALASLGITLVSVFRRPRVGIVSTGDEIVPSDGPQPLGRIRDSNSYHLEGLVTQSGGQPVRLGIVPDDPDRLKSVVNGAIQNCDMVIITGGSSVGTADHTERVLDSLGPPGVVVHGVSIKPGKPVIAGWAGRVAVFGLPGHPVAVGVCFELFVRPVLQRMSGEVCPPALEGISHGCTVRARLARSISSGPGREEYVRVVLERSEDGLWARPVFGPSGLINTLVKADGIIVIPADSIGIEAGADVEVRLF